MEYPKEKNVKALLNNLKNPEKMEEGKRQLPKLLQTQSPEKKQLIFQLASSFSDDTLVKLFLVLQSYMGKKGLSEKLMNELISYIEPSILAMRVKALDFDFEMPKGIEPMGIPPNLSEIINKIYQKDMERGLRNSRLVDFYSQLPVENLTKKKLQFRVAANRVPGRKPRPENVKVPELGSFGSFLAFLGIPDLQREHLVDIQHIRNLRKYENFNVPNETRQNEYETQIQRVEETLQKKLNKVPREQIKATLAELNDKMPILQVIKPEEPQKPKTSIFSIRKSPEEIQYEKNMRSYANALAAYEDSQLKKVSMSERIAELQNLKKVYEEALRRKASGGAGKTRRRKLKRKTRSH